MKTSSLLSHVVLCWPGLRTAADPQEIVALGCSYQPRATPGFRISAHYFSYPISYFFCIPSLHVANLTICPCMQKRIELAEISNFVSQSACSLHGGDRLQGAGWRPAGTGRTSVLEQGSPLPVVLVCERTCSVHCNFCGIYFFWYRPELANQRHYITVLEAFVYVFPLFGMLCLFVYSRACSVGWLPFFPAGPKHD